VSEDWIGRWREGRTGWHKASVHPLFERWWDALGVPAGARVLVPLAGASLDIAALLERGYEVDAVELAGEAIEAFFERQGWPAEREVVADGIALWRHDRLRFFEADFFDLDGDLLGGTAYDAVYDRAALIALDREGRRRYAQQLGGLCASGTRQLLISLEYPDGFRDGPPFSVGTAEVARRYGNDWRITALGRHPESDRPLTEAVYKLEKR